MSKYKNINIIKSIFTSFWTYWVLFLLISYLFSNASLTQVLFIGFIPFAFIFMFYFIGIMLFILTRPFSKY